MKNKNLLESFSHAIEGVVHTVRTERNMKLHIVAAAIVLILSLFYRLTREELLVVVLTIAFVIVCELFNTAIEALVDIVVDVYHPKAKMVKDVAAGAVMISAFVSLLVGYVIFIGRVSSPVEFAITKLKNSPMNVTIIAMAITLLLVLCLKALSGTGKPLKGGMPSGHAAVAFSIATAISLWTMNAKVSILCLLLALLVIQARLEAKIHSLLEVLAGSVLGALVTLLLFQIFS